jgi:hypothetical protein
MAKSEGVQELSPGWRLGGTLGIGSKKARSSEGAKESFDRRAKKAAQYSRMTISCDIAGFLALLQSGPRLTFNTQGSAEPPPWAKFLYAFGVYSSCEHFEPKRMAIGNEAKGNSL